MWTGRNGERYDGQWADDYYHGVGTLRTKGAVYEGEFKRSKRHGHGTIVFADSSWYEGEFRNDLYEGTGEHIDSTGGFVGEHNRGVRHGQGKFTNTEGVVYSGGWKAGVAATNSNARRRNVGKLRETSCLARRNVRCNGPNTSLSQA